MTRLLVLTVSPKVMAALSAGSAASVDMPAWPSAVRVTLSQPLSTMRFGVETSDSLTLCTGAEKMTSPVRLETERSVSPETMLPPAAPVYSEEILPAIRVIMVTNSARVSFLFGASVVAVSPLTMPLATRAAAA